MAQKEKAHALYLADPETGDVKLIHADDLQDKQAAGWKQPTGQKANGAEWNHEDDLEAQDATADFAKARIEMDAKKAEDASKEAEAEQKAADKAAEAKADEPDMKVQVVQAPKASNKR